MNYHCYQPIVHFKVAKNLPRKLPKSTCFILLRSIIYASRHNNLSETTSTTTRIWKVFFWGVTTKSLIQYEETGRCEMMRCEKGVKIASRTKCSRSQNWTFGSKDLNPSTHPSFMIFTKFLVISDIDPWKSDEKSAFTIFHVSYARFRGWNGLKIALIACLIFNFPNRKM